MSKSDVLVACKDEGGSGLYRIRVRDTGYPVASELTSEYAILFAAAPELLARLNLAVRYLEHPDVQAIPFAAPAGGCAELCRAAIAKATGQG